MKTPAQLISGSRAQYYEQQGSRPPPRNHAFLRVRRWPDRPTVTDRFGYHNCTTSDRIRIDAVCVDADSEVGRTGSGRYSGAVNVVSANALHVLPASARALIRVARLSGMASEYAFAFGLMAPGLPETSSRSKLMSLLVVIHW